MVRVAAERISDLFALAEREALAGDPELANRYVQLARRIGMRYNVRLLPEYAEVFCRGCSGFWVEGRTVRTRLRAGRRVRTCLRCGRERRVSYGLNRMRGGVVSAGPVRRFVQPEVGVLETPTPPSEGTVRPRDRNGR